MSSRLRVLWVTDLFPHAGRPFWGEAFVELARSLAQHVDLEVLSPAYRAFWTPRGSFLEWYRGQPARVDHAGFAAHYPACRAFPWRFTIARQACSMERGLAPAAARLHAERPFDVVHAISALPPGPAARRIAADLRCPLVVTAVGSDLLEYPRYRALGARLREILGAAACVTGVSRELVERAAELGAARERLRWIPSGCRVEERPEVPRHGGRILFVGKLTRVKGFDVLLRAFRRVREARRDAELLVIGGFADREADAWLRESGAGVAVRGTVPREELIEAMRRADVFCLPSRREGMPLVVLEAMAEGLPVVATRVGGIPDAVTGPGLGRLVPPEDAEALAAALAEALRASWDRAAIRAAAARYDWDRIAGEYATVYGAAVGGR